MRAPLLALLLLIVPFFAFAGAYETGTPDPSIYEKTCAKSDKTDVVLVVDGKKLLVNKALLSYHSDYFNTLFNSECTENSMEEIEIKDVDFENFVTLLSLIGDNPLEINEQNAEKLLELADRFLMRSPKLLVANVVKSLPEFSKHNMLLLADKYNLEDLLQYSLSLYTSKEDYKCLSRYTKSDLFLGTKMTETPEPSIYEKAFAKSDRTDAILVVDGKKLHVNKALLSYHSDYFNSLFNSDFTEKSKKEIEIKDVDFEDFATLLSLIQDNPLEINKRNAEKLLELADRFLMRSPKLLVANVVKNSTEYSKFQVLLLADKYDLEDLIEYSLTLYDSKDDFEDLYYDRELLHKLSDATKGKLF